MAAESGTVAAEEDSLAVESPSCPALAITAVGEVEGSLLARCVNEGDVGTVPTTAAHIA